MKEYTAEDKALTSQQNSGSIYSWSSLLRVCKSCVIFNSNILHGAPITDLLGLLSCKSDSWRRCTCSNVLLVYEGEVGELLQPGAMWGLPWGLLYGTNVTKDLCMVPYYSCHIYGFGQARAKRCGRCLKSHQLGVTMQITKGGSFHREGRFPLCNTVVLWSFCPSLSGYIL